MDARNGPLEGYSESIASPLEPPVTDPKQLASAQSMMAPSFLPSSDSIQIEPSLLIMILPTQWIDLRADNQSSPHRKLEQIHYQTHGHTVDD